MKKHILILLLIPFLLGVAPSRQNTFNPNTVIRSDEVNEDFDDIFGYVQEGIDVLGDFDFGDFTCTNNVCALDSSMLITVNVNNFGDPTVDIGNSINLAIANISPRGGTIVIPTGNFPCLTAVSLAVGANNQAIGTPIKIVGAGGDTDRNSGYGTHIDGSSLAVPVIDTGTATARRNIYLQGFEVKAGTSHGIRLFGAWSTFRDLTVWNATGTNIYGFHINSNFGGLMENLYAAANTNGFYFQNMNAAKVLMIAARENTNRGVVINGGNGADFSELYIESNGGAILEVGGTMRGSSIGPLYSENNCYTGTVTDAINIGYKVSSLTDVDFHDWFLPELSKAATNMIKLNYGTNLSFRNIFIGTDVTFAIKSGATFSGHTLFENVYVGIVGQKIEVTSVGNTWENCYIENGVEWLYNANDIIINSGKSGTHKHGWIKTAAGWDTSGTASPTTNTWKRGDRIWNTAINPLGSPGWNIVRSGTFGAATDNTGDTDGSTAVITGMTDTSDFELGDYVSVSNGWPSATAPYRVIASTSTTLTLASNSDSAEVNVTVASIDPVINTMPNAYGGAVLTTSVSSSTELEFKPYSSQVQLLTAWGSTLTGNQRVAGDVLPGTHDTHYIGKNDDDTPFAWKGVILKDTMGSTVYRVEVIDGAVSATDLTD